MTSTFQRAITLALIVAGSSSCRLGQVVVPDLAGPAGFGLSVQLTASPDLLPRDGQSTSTITITARDDKSQPKRDLGLRIDLTVNGVPGDFGTLSARTVYTNSDGRATVVYTAPRAPSFESADSTAIAVVATPIGTDAGNSTATAVNISLVPQGTIVLPNDKAPVPQFFSTPSQPVDQEPIHFDASASNDPDGIIVSYGWAFGDGGTKETNRPTIDYDYETAGTYQVTLTVTDDRGARATSAPVSVTVASHLPTASFVVSPTDPSVGANVFLNASSSTAPLGRTLVSYAWDFGDGSAPASGVQPPAHQYQTANIFTITLVVTDSTGRQATSSQTIKVK